MVLAKKLVFVYGEATFSWHQYCSAIKHLYGGVVAEKIPSMESIQKHIPVLHLLLVTMSDRLDMLTEFKESMESRVRSEWT